MNKYQFDFLRSRQTTPPKIRNEKTPTDAAANKTYKSDDDVETPLTKTANTPHLKF